MKALSVWLKHQFSQSSQVCIQARSGEAYDGFSCHGRHLNPWTFRPSALVHSTYFQCFVKSYLSWKQSETASLH